MKNRHEDSGNTMFLLVCLMIVILLLVPAWYAARAGKINGGLLELAKAQIVAFTPFSEEADKAWELITQADPAALTWDQVMNVVRYSGKWVRWPYALILVALGGMCLFMSRTSGLIRRLNMDSLLRHNAESFACLRPVVGRGNALLSPESYDSGPWRIARSPVQFALEHGLLLNKDGQPFSVDEALRRGLAHVDLPAFGDARFDEARAAIVLKAQLGKKFDGFETMSAGRKALAAAFIAYAAGNKNDCLLILDTVATSYEEVEKPSCSVLVSPNSTVLRAPTCPALGELTCPRLGKPISSVVEKLFWPMLAKRISPVLETLLTPVLQKLNFHKTLDNILQEYKGLLIDPFLIRHAAYELPWFMALLTLARRKGVLASSQFLWLRPLDRPLWYALSQCGGRAAWAEGFAAWAHFAAEEKMGKALREPRLTHAVGRLRQTLAVQGWLTDDPCVFESAGLSLDKEVMFAPAEEHQEEYDANEDESLKNELC